MATKLNCVLLIDDDANCNFFHKRLFQKIDCTDSIEITTNGKDALDFLNSRKSKVDLILLDLDMPVMNGIKFLEVYEELEEDKKARVVIVMTSSSFSPYDKIKANSFSSVKEFKTKYLDQEDLANIFQQYFPTNLNEFHFHRSERQNQNMSSKSKLIVDKTGMIIYKDQEYEVTLDNRGIIWFTDPIDNPMKIKTTFQRDVYNRVHSIEDAKDIVLYMLEVSKR